LPMRWGSRLTGLCLYRWRCFCVHSSR
jgi:hypothetical protein